MSTLASSLHRIRGSLIDVVTLVEFAFYYDPAIKTVDKTMYGVRDIIGNRLPNRLWVGQGSGDVTLEVFLLDTTNMQAQLDGLRTLLLPQDDIQAPHPVYIIAGGLFTGRWFVLEAMDGDITGVTYDNTMTPYEVTLKLKFCEIPVDNSYTGMG